MHTTILMRFLYAWFTAGLLMLLLTPLQAWTPLLGWAPTLWLLVSPLLMLLALQPALPLRLLAVWLRHRRTRRQWESL